MSTRIARACNACLNDGAIFKRGLTTSAVLRAEVAIREDGPSRPPRLGRTSYKSETGIRRNMTRPSSQTLPQLMGTLARLRSESRRPTASAYIAIMRAALEYAERRRDAILLDGRAETESGNEGLGWQIAIAAWEDAKKGDVDLGSDGLDLLSRFCGLYPHLLHSLIIETAKTSEPTLATYQALSRAAIINQNLEQLLVIMDEMLGRDMRLGDGLIKHAVRMLCEWGLPRIAVGVVERAEEEVGNKAELGAWMQILQASAEAQYLEGVELAWNRIVPNQSYTPDEGLILAVLGVAGRWGRPDIANNALSVLELLSIRPREEHLAPLLESFCHAGQVPNAIKQLSVLRAAGVTPTISTVQPIVSVLSTSVDILDQAFYALEDMRENGEVLDISALNALIEASVRLEDLQRARATQTAAADLGLTPDIDTFNLMLSGCISAKHRALGDIIMSEMAANSIAPDSTTYERMVILCLTQPTYEDAFYYLERMKSEGIKPGYTTYEALARKCAAVEDQRWRMVVEELESVGHRMTDTLAKFVSNGGKYESAVRPLSSGGRGASPYKNEKRSMLRRDMEGKRRTHDQLVGEKRRQWVSRDVKGEASVRS